MPQTIFVGWVAAGHVKGLSEVAILFPFFISESLSRAAFVAALALLAFALFRYWRCLDKMERRVRWLLVALRGAALLLLLSALAGVGVEYETAANARVLVHTARVAGQHTAASTDARQSTDQSTQEIISAVQQQSFAVVEEGATELASSTGDRAYIAGVLSTDGALRADEAEREVKRLSATTGGAPVFVVINQQQDAGPMVALESAHVTSPPVRGVPLGVHCIVHGRGMRGHESLVTVADQAKVQASARVAWMSDDEWQALTLEVVPKVVGWTNYIVRVEAAGSEDSSVLSRPLSLYIEERRWRVLFFEGEPTWEAKFIRRALERSQLFEVDYFAQVSRAAAVGTSEKAVEQKDDAANKDGTAEADKSTAANQPAAKLHAVLGQLERLNSYDCIIVGATPNEMLSAAEAARLSAWTERRGGGLIITGGNSFAGSIAAPNGKLYKLLPAAIDPRGFVSEAQQLSRGVPLEAEKTRDSLTLVPTSAGASGALGGYLRTVQETAAKADVLTGQGLRLGATRPGASVLAVMGRGGVTGTSEAGTPLITAARYGAGRTLLFAPADSWRLRTSASGEQDEANAPYSTLWQGLTLWAAAGARPPAEITLSDDSPAAGRNVTVEIRVRDALFAPTKIEQLNARLQPLKEDDGEASGTLKPPQEVAFIPDESDKSVWRATLAVDVPGQYALETDYVAGGKSGSIVKNFAVGAARTDEPGAARDTLKRLARETGGELLYSNDTTALVERLSAATSLRERTLRAWELRAWWPLAFIIPLLLSAAWLIERMRAE